MRVSACMIVKNEEKMLPRCLESIKWVDELVVVDTGSNDDTMKIAGSYGAKVYHHPWENDFSLHRNQSIGYATCDWLLIIDADEEIVSDMQYFKDRLPRIDSHIGALAVSMQEVNDGRPTTSWLSLRFFRRASNLRYKNVVHNKATYLGIAAGTDIKINHYGYSLTPDKMKEKLKRSEALLHERLKDNPDDFNCFYYLTQMRIGEKLYDEAEEYGLKFFHTVPIGTDSFQFYGVMYFYMAWIYLHKDDGEKAYAWAKKGLESYPDDLDLNYVVAEIGWRSKREDDFKTHSKKYFELLPQVRDRGGFESDTFKSELDTTRWFNRSVYTGDEIAEETMREFERTFND